MVYRAYEAKTYEGQSTNTENDTAKYKLLLALLQNSRFNNIPQCIITLVF
jgi:hypothetical protein